MKENKRVEEVLPSETKQNVRIFQQCTNESCGTIYPVNQMLSGCKQCQGRLEYGFEGEYDGKPDDRDDLWKNMALIPLENPENIISLGVGGSEIVHIQELSPQVNGANLYLMMDSEKNPTGTFKDREASIVLSRCKEMGLDNLVFYSTGNTGRSYTTFAAHLGLTSFFFMPRQCQYKNTDFIKRNPNNYIILVDDHYPQISPYAKKFAKANGLTPIAPLHDRTESYATVAYEQVQQLPHCDYFVQTIASGMGPLGFYKGHKNLVRLGLEHESDIPRVICIQSSEMNVMARAYNSGKTVLTKEDLPKEFPDNLFEPTLNSTNPVNNYPQLYEMLKENNGIITDVEPSAVLKESAKIVDALKQRGLSLRTDLENSLLIEYAGLIKLANQGVFKKDENILLISCGRGKDTSTTLLEVDAVINPQTQDPVELMKKLSGS